MRATDTEEPFGWWLLSPEYGAVGYWRGSRPNDTNKYWLLTEPDAKLIAAAPILLNAAQKAFDALEAFGLSDGLTHGLSVAQCLLESAIAEAKL